MNEVIKKSVIEKSTNPKIKQKFNVVIDKINEANASVKLINQYYK